MTDPKEVPWTAFDDGEIWAGSEQLGAMRTVALAREACDAHNAALSARKMAERGVTGGMGMQFGDGGSQTDFF